MGRIVITMGLVSLIMLSLLTPGYSEECRGDIDGSGAVDGSDLSEMASDYGSVDCPVKTIMYIICEGELSAGGRWCDNGNGTVTDMTTGLVWLQDAGCKGPMDWWNSIKDAIENLRVGICGLTDDSEWGDWRLPTRDELDTFANGSEVVREDTPRGFKGVEGNYYWSSTTDAGNPNGAWYLRSDDGNVRYWGKDLPCYVWPVRGGND